jgi:hypothetical protein
MGLTATYESNFVQTKEGAGKGKTFHRYTITGTKEEIAEFKKSQQFKDYPRTNALGQPQIVTLYMDALRDVLPVYKKQDGNFTLDQSETRKDLARAEALEQVSPQLAGKFADTVMSRITGVSQNAINAVKQPAEDTVEETPIDKL